MFLNQNLGLKKTEKKTRKNISFDKEFVSFLFISKKKTGRSTIHAQLDILVKPPRKSRYRRWAPTKGVYLRQQVVGEHLRLQLS